MRAYPLRLKDELADAARAHADSLGISFNALVAVALDAYLRGQAVPAVAQHSKVSKPAPAKRPRVKRTKPAPISEEDRPDFRFFHPDPDDWPYFDPEFSHRFSDDLDDAQCVALELEYWSTRTRPSH